MLKILGGIGRGLSLSVPKKDTIRPTSVLLKRRIFDKFQNLDSKIFIDCCAGSGAMGLEAWSRGAQKLILVEASKQVFEILKKNHQKVNQSYPDEVEARPISVRLARVEKWLMQFQKEYQAWDSSQQQNTIFFFDPPYGDLELYKKVVSSLDWFRGAFWIESDTQKGLPIEYWDQHFPSLQILQQGSHYIIIAHR